MKNVKKWYMSKSVWSALLKALSGVLASLALVLSGDITFVAFLPGATMMLWGAVDVAIRFKTTQSLN